jgi:hypothetical protein
MANGTKFKMAYGNQKLETRNQKQVKHEVWRDYAGVWHMNEDSGTAYDSTVHGLDGIPSCGTNGTAATMAQMVAYENGACGRARVNATVQMKAGNYLHVPSYDALQLGSRFIASIWLNGDEVDTGYYPRPISRKVHWKDNNGWEFQINPESTFMKIHGSSDIEISVDIPDMINNWMEVTLVYDNSKVSCFTNGVFAKEGTIVAVKDNGQPLSFGCDSDGDDNTFCGQYDEIRLRGGSLSADRIKADYDMIVNRNFLRYGPVENGKGAAE